MPHRFRSLLGLSLCSVLLFSLLVGCSATNEDADAEVDTGATEVSIGFAAPLTGDNAVYGQGMQRAVELAFSEANASETVKAAGYTFVIRAEDDQADPKQAVNVANLLAGDSRVVGVIGHFNSGCSIPASAVYQEAGVPMISVSSNPQLTAQGFDAVNRIVAKDDAQGSYAAGLLLNTLGISKVAVVDDSTQYGQGLADEFVKVFEADGGEIVTREQIQVKEVDFTALVTKIKTRAPQAIYFAGGHAEGGVLSKQMTEGGLTIPLIGGDLIFSQDFIDVAGADNAEGDVATILGLPLEQQPRGKDFQAAYETEYGKAPEAYDSYAYDQAWIYVNAVLEVGPDRAALIDAIRDMSFDGVTGITEFNSDGDTSNQVISAYRVEGGTWTQLVE